MGTCELENSLSNMLAGHHACVGTKHRVIGLVNVLHHNNHLTYMTSAGKATLETRIKGFRT